MPTEKPAEALTISNLSKRFGGRLVLEDVNLSLRAGEVHALLGQNGSGKSTLIKILAGFHQPESRAFATVAGAPLELGSAEESHRLGIRFIHQDLALIPDLDVVDNLALGQRYAHKGWLSAARERASARRVLRQYGLDLDVSAAAWTLTAAQCTMLAIVRAVHHRDQSIPGVLVLDEPTAALHDSEKDQLFAMIRLLRESGTAILYVTHRLREVYEIADRVTILRDGHNVQTREVEGLRHDDLVELIVGRPLEKLYPDLESIGGDVVMSVTQLKGRTVRDFALDLHHGEIVGVTGLAGSGAEDVLHLLSGSRPREGGVISLNGKQVTASSPRETIAAGIGFAPGDRKRLAAMVGWSITENITLPMLRGVGPGNWLTKRAETRDTRHWVRRLAIEPPDPDAVFGTLSGGNQQKSVLARWLRCGSQVFLFEEPTAGVDIGSKTAIYKLLAELSQEGRAVLLATSDYEEACAICDRVIVMSDGVIAKTLRGSERSPENILIESLRQRTQPTASEGASRV